MASRIGRRDRILSFLSVLLIAYVVIILRLTVHFDHFSPNLLEWWSHPECREAVRSNLLLFPAALAVWCGAVVLDSRSRS